MSRITSWIALGLAAVLAALAGFWLARQLDSPDPQLTSGTWLPQPRELPEFQLVDHTGAPFTRESLRGHATLVFFGFTHCPDVCPTTMAQLAQIKAAAALPDLQVLLVSVDPERDTPETLERYVHAFDPDFIGLTGTPQAIEELTSAMGVAVARTELPGGDYTVDHSAAVFLLNAQGQMVGVFTPPFDVSRFAEDLRRAAPHLGV